MPEPRDAPGGGARKPFEYAIVRVVPRVERGEVFNAGIVLHSRPHRYLGARTELDEAVLAALSPDCDPETVREHLSLIDRIARGRPGRRADRRADAPRSGSTGSCRRRPR